MAEETNVEQVVNPDTEGATQLENKESFNAFNLFDSAKHEVKEKAPVAKEEVKDDNDKPLEQSDDNTGDSSGNNVSDSGVAADNTNGDVKTEEIVKPAPRDLSIFEGEDPKFISSLKKMGNDAFANFSKLYSENKSLKTTPKSDLPPHYYSNPNGYLLHPEYGKTVQYFQQAEMIQDYWKEQLISIEETGKWKDMDLDKDGRFVIGEEKQATKQDKMLIDKWLDNAKDQTRNFKGKLEGIVTGFQDKYKSDIAVIKDAEIKLFPDFDKKDHPTRKIQDAVIQQIPESLRDSPLAPLLAKVTAHNSLLMAENKRLKGEQNKKIELQKDADKAPPTKNNFQQGGRSNGLSSFSDFARIKNEGK